MHVAARIEQWPMKEPFNIAGKSFTDAELLVVEVEQDGWRGRGEACGVYYRNDLPPRMVGQIDALLATSPVFGRTELQSLLPAGGARNALDCALWELEAAKLGSSVSRLAGITALRALPTVFTIGVEPPEEVARRAERMTHARAIKLKLAGDGWDADRLRALRTVRPDVWLGVDANRGFDRAALIDHLPLFAALGVALIEQPLPIGREADMAGLDRTIPFAADESVQTLGDLAALVGLFDVINIKLDKCGGLTHALEMVTEARRLGFRLMVGNMTGTSWSQAAGFVIGQLCDYVDLDGATFLAGDREVAVHYADGTIHCPDSVWGTGVRL